MTASDARDERLGARAPRDDQRRVRSREAEFQALIEGLQSGVALINGAGEFTLYNRRFLELFGLSRDADIENVNSQNWSAWQVVHPTGRLLHVDEHPVRRASLTRQAVRDQLVGVRLPSGGPLRWMLVTAEPMLTDQGALSEIICTYHDVTAQREAEERAARREAQLRFAMDASLAIVFEWDIARDRVRRIQSTSAALPAEGEVGRTLEEVASVVHPADRDLFRANVAAALMAPDGRYRSEFRIVDPGGEVRWLTESGGVEFGHDRTPLRLVGISLDVTDRKKSQEELRAAGERLREAHERLRLHVETTPLAVVEWSAEYRVVGYSARAEAMFGFTRDEVLGKRIDEIPWVPEGDWPAVRTAMGEMRTAVRTANVSHNRNRRKDGRVIHCDWYSSALHDERGQLLSVLSFVLDVTERVNAEESLRASEEQLRVLADAMPQLVWTAAPDGTVDYMNARHAGLFGARREPGGDWTWTPAIHPDDLEATLSSWRGAIAAGERYEMEQRVRVADGSYRWHLARAEPVRDETGRVVRWYGTTTDIHDLKEAQQALRDADRRKDEFLAMLSHELRNPLAPIRNSTHILQHAAPGSEQARRAQTVIQRQTAHLAHLVDDLLDVTRIARGKIELRRSQVDLRDLVARVAEDFRVSFRERGVVFETAIPDERLWAEVDETRIVQLIGNLLDNAAKYTSQGDRVTLSVVAVDGAAELHVHDTGAGIDPELLPVVFDAFVQGERGLARTQGGLGLGLAIVKGIATLHGGTVRAASAGKGKGSEFVVSVPILARPQERSSTSPVPARRGGGRRVLVVDDNVDAAETLAEIVRMLGHEVDVAHDGATAIDRARANPPDVVLCDIGLPGMSGYEVAKALRATVAGGMQLIAVSGYAQPEDVKRAMEAGFDRHVTKPPDIDEIERLLS